MAAVFSWGTQIQYHLLNQASPDCLTLVPPAKATFSGLSQSVITLLIHASLQVAATLPDLFLAANPAPQ